MAAESTFSPEEAHAFMLCVLLSFNAVIKPFTSTCFVVMLLTEETSALKESDGVRKDQI